LTILGNTLELVRSLATSADPELLSLSSALSNEPGSEGEAFWLEFELLPAGEAEGFSTTAAALLSGFVPATLFAANAVELFGCPTGAPAGCEAGWAIFIMFSSR
jgi:hypothetical protein